MKKSAMAIMETGTTAVCTKLAPDDDPVTPTGVEVGARVPSGLEEPGPLADCPGNGGNTVCPDAPTAPAPEEPAEGGEFPPDVFCAGEDPGSGFG